MHELTEWKINSSPASQRHLGTGNGSDGATTNFGGSPTGYYSSNDYEARSLFRRSMDILLSIAENSNTRVVVITSSRSYSKRHSNLLTMIKNRRHATLLGKRRKIKGEAKMWLTHLPSGISGYRKRITKQENLYESVSRVINSRLSIEGVEEIE